MFDVKSQNHNKNLKRKNKRVGIQKGEHKVKSMTVCIAAIAESNSNRPKIVIASDREVTTPLLSYTSSVPKMRILNDYCWVMISTDHALFAQDIITKAIEKINELSKESPKEKLSIEHIVKIVSAECKKMMDEERERAILAPLSLDYDSYLNRSKDLPIELVGTLANDLKTFENEVYVNNFRAEFLVVGIDSAPHIFTVIQNGQYVSSDQAGFAMVGSGNATAFPEFTKYSYRPDNPWLYVLHRVYTSKKVAERVGGVGPDTDLIVLHKGDDGNTHYWEADLKTKDLLDSGIKQVRDQEGIIYTNLLQKFETLLNAPDTKK